MAISNATRLADFGTGIGTQGATITVDNTNNRLGVGTTAPGTTFQVGVGASIGNDGTAVFAGEVTAGAFLGDGSQLTGVSGFSTALASSGPGQQQFKTNETLTIGAGTSYKVESDDASGNVAFSRCANIHLGTGATFVVGTGTTLALDVLGVFN